MAKGVASRSSQLPKKNVRFDIGKKFESADLESSNVHLLYHSAINPLRVTMGLCKLSGDENVEYVHSFITTAHSSELGQNIPLRGSDL